MEKNIKDYLHLYGLWLPVLYKGGKYKERQYKVQQINEKGVRLEYCTKNKSYSWVMAEYDKIKPFLRPLSDMTEEEFTEYAKTRGYNETPNLTRKDKGWTFGTEDGSSGTFLSLVPPYGDRHKPESFLYLLSKHFDLFNLISDGLAIDKTKS